jgi:hypothetical protein
MMCRAHGDRGAVPVVKVPRAWGSETGTDGHDCCAPGAEWTDKWHGICSVTPLTRPSSVKFSSHMITRTAGGT